MGDAADEQAPAAGDPAGDPAGASTLTVDLSARSVAVALAALTLLSAVVVAVGRAPIASTLVVIALFLGLALDPVTVFVERRAHLSRGWATAVVLGTAVVLAVVFMALAAPELATQSKDIGRQLPRTIDSLGDLPVVGSWLRDQQVPHRLHDLLGTLPERLAGKSSDLGKLTGSLAFGAGTAILGFLLVAGVLLDGPGLVDLTRRAIPPADRPVADQIGGLVYDVLARYFAGNLLLSVMHGAWVSLTGILLGIPLSPVLGVWVAVTSLIPQIGGLIGFVVVFAVSLTQGVGVTIVMSALFFTYMTFNNNVLLPVVVGRAVDVPAAVTMVAAIAGFSVAGVAGSLLAVPTVAAIKAVTSFVRHHDEPGYERPVRGPALDLRAVARSLRPSTRGERRAAPPT